MVRRGPIERAARQQRGHSRLACLIAVLAAGCSPTIESNDGSFESGPGGSSAGEDDSDGSTGEETTSDGDADPSPAAACQDYLTCLGALTSDQLGAMMAEFGEGGRCYNVQPLETCENQCGVALDALVETFDPVILPIECGGTFTGMTENTDATCSDGMDNDGNGFIDCDDLGCHGTGVSVCVSNQEDNDAACSDGIDNDGNGFIDCDDFGCAPPDVTVCATNEDNQAACSDGIDNDDDGFFDCDDFDCSMNPNVNCSIEDTDALCDDNQDNDGDGFFDCDDFDCSMNPNVTVCG